MCSFKVHHDGEARKSRKLEGGSKAAIVAFVSPSTFFLFCATVTWYTSKDHIFNVDPRFYERKLFSFSKNWKKSDYKMPLHLAAENGHFAR